MPTEHRSPRSREKTDVDELLESISSECFREWYRERQHRLNIENGTPYFNGPSPPPDPFRHSPSKLLQCHRKLFYRQQNAPAETPEPEGIFWFGTRFEEDIAFPFLKRAVTVPGTYVRNTIWLDWTVETDAGELRLKGATDPVIVDEDSVPILPTEVKTKSSLDYVDSPGQQHRAQVHAYLTGLSDKFEVELTDAVVLYGSRKSLDMKAFHVEFDEEFWRDVVLRWAREHTQYRLDDKLPPDSPEHGWECKFCDYRERCGKGKTVTAGEGPVGFLPLFKEYPKETVMKYLEAHDGVLLTPTLAHEYPELASVYGSYSWECPVCGATRAPQSVEWSGDICRPPVCVECGSDGICSELSGPSPEEQAEAMGDQNA